MAATDEEAGDLSCSPLDLRVTSKRVGGSSAELSPSVHGILSRGQDDGMRSKELEPKRTYAAIPPPTIASKRHDRALASSEEKIARQNSRFPPSAETDKARDGSFPPSAADSRRRPAEPDAETIGLFQRYLRLRKYKRKMAEAGEVEQQTIRIKRARSEPKSGNVDDVIDCNDVRKPAMPPLAPLGAVLRDMVDTNERAGQPADTTHKPRASSEHSAVTDSPTDSNPRDNDCRFAFPEGRPVIDTASQDAGAHQQTDSDHPYYINSVSSVEADTTCAVSEQGGEMEEEGRDGEETNSSFSDNPLVIDEAPTGSRPNSTASGTNGSASPGIQTNESVTASGQADDTPVPAKSQSSTGSKEKGEGEPSENLHKATRFIKSVMDSCLDQDTNTTDAPSIANQDRTGDASACSTPDDDVMMTSPFHDSDVTYPTEAEIFKVMMTTTSAGMVAKPDAKVAIIQQINRGIIQHQRIMGRMCYLVMRHVRSSFLAGYKTKTSIVMKDPVRHVFACEDFHLSGWVVLYVISLSSSIVYSFDKSPGNKSVIWSRCVKEIQSVANYVLSGGDKSQFGGFVRSTRIQLKNYEKNKLPSAIWTDDLLENTPGDTAIDDILCLLLHLRFFTKLFLLKNKLSARAATEPEKSVLFRICSLITLRHYMDCRGAAGRSIAEVMQLDTDSDSLASILVRLLSSICGTGNKFLRLAYLGEAKEALESIDLGPYKSYSYPIPLSQVIALFAALMGLRKQANEKFDQLLLRELNPVAGDDAVVDLTDADEGRSGGSSQTGSSAGGPAATSGAVSQVPDRPGAPAQVNQTFSPPGGKVVHHPSVTQHHYPVINSGARQRAPMDNQNPPTSVASEHNNGINVCQQPETQDTPNKGSHAADHQSISIGLLPRRAPVEMGPHQQSQPVPQTPPLRQMANVVNNLQDARPFMTWTGFVQRPLGNSSNNAAGGPRPMIPMIPMMIPRPPPYVAPPKKKRSRFCMSMFPPQPRQIVQPPPPKKSSVDLSKFSTVLLKMMVDDPEKYETTKVALMCELLRRQIEARNQRKEAESQSAENSRETSPVESHNRTEPDELQRRTGRQMSAPANPAPEKQQQTTPTTAGNHATRPILAGVLQVPISLKLLDGTNPPLCLPGDQSALLQPLLAYQSLSQAINPQTVIKSEPCTPPPNIPLCVESKIETEPSEPCEPYSVSSIYLNQTYNQSGVRCKYESPYHDFSNSDVLPLVKREAKDDEAESAERRTTPNRTTDTECASYTTSPGLRYYSAEEHPVDSCVKRYVDSEGRQQVIEDMRIDLPRVPYHPNPIRTAVEERTKSFSGDVRNICPPGVEGTRAVESIYPPRLVRPQDGATVPTTPTGRGRSVQIITGDTLPDNRQPARRKFNYDFTRDPNEQTQPVKRDLMEENSDFVGGEVHIRNNIPELSPSASRHELQHPIDRRFAQPINDNQRSQATRQNSRHNTPRATEELNHVFQGNGGDDVGSLMCGDTSTTRTVGVVSGNDTQYHPNYNLTHPQPRHEGPTTPMFPNSSSTRRVVLYRTNSHGAPIHVTSGNDTIRHGTTDNDTIRQSTTVSGYPVQRQGRGDRREILESRSYHSPHSPESQPRFNGDSFNTQSDARCDYRDTALENTGARQYSRNNNDYEGLGNNGDTPHRDLHHGDSHNRDPHYQYTHHRDLPSVQPREPCHTDPSAIHPGAPPERVPPLIRPPDVYHINPSYEGSSRVDYGDCQREPPQGEPPQFVDNDLRNSTRYVQFAGAQIDDRHIDGESDVIMISDDEQDSVHVLLTTNSKVVQRTHGPNNQARGVSYDQPTQNSDRRKHATHPKGMRHTPDKIRYTPPGHQHATNCTNYTTRARTRGDDVIRRVNATPDPVMTPNHAEIEFGGVDLPSAHEDEDLSRVYLNTEAALPMRNVPSCQEYVDIHDIMPLDLSCRK